MPDNTIFISYSRRDAEFMERLSTDLKIAGFSLWVDTQNLTPGTASWERAIRDAIRDAVAVVLVASPDALQSDYVQGELTLAQLQNRPIFPIWANGEEWINCVPLNMANYQYADARNEQYNLNLPQFINTLQSAIHGGAFTLSLPDHETITISIEQYPRYDVFLYEYWITYISAWYEAYTYGSDWVLGNVKTKQLALPEEWLSLSMSTHLHQELNNWAELPLEHFGILPDSNWGIWEFKKISVIGIMVNDQQAYDSLRSYQSIQKLLELYRYGKLKAYRASDINHSNYSYRLIIGLTGASIDFSRTIIKTYADGTSINWDNLQNKLVIVEDK